MSENKEKEPLFEKDSNMVFEGELKEPKRVKGSCYLCLFLQDGGECSVKSHRERSYYSIHPGECDGYSD